MNLTSDILTSFNDEIEKTALSRAKMLGAGIEAVKRLAKKSLKSQAMGTKTFGQLMGTTTGRQAAKATKSMRAFDIARLKGLKNTKSSSFRKAVSGSIGRLKRGTPYGHVRATTAMSTNASELPAFLRYGRPA